MGPAPDEYGMFQEEQSSSPMSIMIAYSWGDLENKFGGLEGLQVYICCITASITA